MPGKVVWCEGVVGLLNDGWNPASVRQDPYFDFLSATQGYQLRDLVQRCCADRGLTVAIAGAEYRCDGEVFPLGRLANEARTTAYPQDWPRLVADYVELTHFGPVAFEEVARIPLPEVSRLVYPELVAADEYPHRDEYVRELAPGLVAVTALDMPDNVLRPPHPVFAELGGPPAVWAFAGRNVRGLPGVENAQFFDDAGVRFHLVTDPSYMTASWAFVLDELVLRVTGLPLGVHGALVMVPVPHMIAFHPISGPDVVQSLLGMAGIAVAEYAQHADTISPDVFWWRSGRWTPLTRSTADAPDLAIDPQFHEMAEQLGFVLPDRRAPILDY